MALKSTIYKAEVDIADIDRDYYQSHSLTLARHPSETEEWLMLRLLAFIPNTGSFTHAGSVHHAPTAAA